MMDNTLAWDYPNPFIINITAMPADADGYGHVNNSVYLAWLDKCVWEHCHHMNIPPDRCRELDRGFAAIKHEIFYLSSAYPGDELRVANWVTLNDGRLKAERRFQIIRLSDQKTLLRAKSDYICTKLSNGKPARIPTEFLSCFAVEPAVQAALEQ